MATENLTFKLATATPFKYDMTKYAQSTESILAFIQKSNTTLVLRGLYIR